MTDSDFAVGWHMQGVIFLAVAKATAAYSVPIITCYSLLGKVTALV